MTNKAKPKILDSIDLIKVLKTIEIIVWEPLVEIYEGIKTKRLALENLLLMSLTLEIVLLLQGDILFWKYLHLEFLYPRYKALLVYRLIIILFPFWAWGFCQVLLKFRLSRRLTQVFIDSGLKSLTGKLPGFIFDKAMDEFTRRLRLSKSGQSLQKFETAKGDLESGLQVYIDEISENRKSGTIDILYSHSPLDDNFPLEGLNTIYPNSFLIGKGRSKVLFGKLEDTPHLLIAGQTGMGKSTFLRQLITSLYVQNKKYFFDLVDLKGGLEFQIFESLPRVNVQSHVSSALGVLNNLADKVIEERMTLLKLNGCKDLLAYQKKDSESISYPADYYRNLNLDRHLLVIDEAFDLFMVGPHASPEEVKKARRQASKIAAQGRAVGIHIVIATQRPDRFALDPQTKSNLTGKICFRLPNHASSMTVMDNKRAAELPNIKGRALWQNSSDQFEVQTPFFTEEQAIQALSPFYKKAPKKPKEEQRTSNINEENDFGL